MSVFGSKNAFYMARVILRGGQLGSETAILQGHGSGLPRRVAPQSRKVRRSAGLRAVAAPPLPRHKRRPNSLGDGAPLQRPRPQAGPLRRRLPPRLHQAQEGVPGAPLRPGLNAPQDPQRGGEAPHGGDNQGPGPRGRGGQAGAQDSAPQRGPRRTPGPRQAAQGGPPAQEPPRRRRPRRRSHEPQGLLGPLRAARRDSAPLRLPPGLPQGVPDTRRSHAASPQGRGLPHGGEGLQADPLPRGRRRLRGQGRGLHKQGGA